MSQSLDAGADDLLRLWHETLLPRRDPEQLARHVARMKLLRFDVAVARRNMREYAGVALVVLFAGWQMTAGGDRVSAGLAIAAAAFVGMFLWYQHRDMRPLDPSTNARDYQAALLQRIDQQVRLLKRVRYWYLLPLYVPVLRVAFLSWYVRPKAALLFLLVTTLFFVALGWVNERVAVRYLEEERKRVEALYAGQEA